MKITFVLIVFSCLFLSSCDSGEHIKKGKEYGKTHTLSECAQQSIDYLEQCSSATDIACLALPLGFSRGCSKTSTADDSFCNNYQDGVLDAAASIKKFCQSSKIPDACFKVLKLPAAVCLKHKK